MSDQHANENEWLRLMKKMLKIMKTTMYTMYIELLYCSEKCKISFTYKDVKR